MGSANKNIILEYYFQNPDMTTKEIAEMFNITRDEAYGILTDPHNTPRYSSAHIFELYEDGYSISTIARLYRVDKKTINMTLCKLGRSRPCAYFRCFFSSTRGKKTVCNLNQERPCRKDSNCEYYICACCHNDTHPNCLKNKKDAWSSRRKK